MNMPLALGRLALVAIFLYFGVTKLLDIDTTAATVSRVLDSSALAGTAAQLGTQVQSSLGMSLPKLLAIVLSAIEVIAAVLIVFNVATRFCGFILLLFALAIIYFSYDFWVGPETERGDKLLHALEYLSIIGGFLLLISLPRRYIVADRRDVDQLAPL